MLRSNTRLMLAWVFDLLFGLALDGGRVCRLQSSDLLQASQMGVLIHGSTVGLVDEGMPDSKGTRRPR
jgi:hypothetical protein